MFDTARIAELRADFDDEDFDEIITLFLHEVEHRLTEITQRSCMDVPGALHFLKGSAANLGFSAFNTACETAEQTQRPDDIAAVMRTYAQSKAAFFDLLNTHTAAP